MQQLMDYKPRIQRAKGKPQKGEERVLPSGLMGLASAGAGLCE